MNKWLQDKNSFGMLAKTLAGLEEILAGELHELGAKNIDLQNRAVSFTGDKALLYRANLSLRCALRVLKPIKENIYVQTSDALYEAIQEIDWSRYLDNNSTLAVDSFVFSNYFNHSKFVSLKVKDAIVDQFREKTGTRPSVDTQNPTLRINVHLAEDKLTIALDSSGDSLHRRGYRLEKNEAPLNEVLAAGLILTSGWDGQSTFIDPMCGSGTLLIEAAQIARNIPAGIIRKNYGFMTWQDYDKELWQRVRQKSQAGIHQNVPQIIGGDISPQALQITANNLERAKLNDSVELRQLALQKLAPPKDAGVVIMNPPYGERMKEEDIIDFYKMIGDMLKQNFTGYEAWILSANKEGLKHLGLRPAKKLAFKNGALDCKFHQFKMYKGSVKAKYQKNS